MSDHLQDIVWRVGLVGRVGWILVFIFWLSIAIVFSYTEAVSIAVLMWIASGLLAVFGWRSAFVPYISAAPQELVVQNRFWRRTIPWEDVEAIKPGYYGLLIKRRSNMAVTAWAVQKSNFSVWTKRRTRADDVAEQLLGLAKQYSSHTNEDECG